MNRNLLDLPNGERTAPRSPLVQRVVLVVLDGLRPDAIEAFDLHNFQRLARDGVATLNASTVAPSVTSVAMASLLTGVPPQTHGILNDRFRLPRPTATLDPLPRVLAAAGLPASCFVRQLPLFFRGIGRRIARHIGVAKPSFAGRGAIEILTAARAYLATQPDGFVFLHWPDADQAGHRHGWMSGHYAEAAQTLDICLGSLAAALDGSDTLLIALADHGGGGVDPRDHESDHPLDRTIPVLLSGDVVLGEELLAASLLDIPATVLWALGVSPPPSYVGRPLIEAFSPAPRELAVAE